jgi:TonB dependent receptor/TonB-dependent Receptor Plug Domain
MYFYFIPAVRRLFLILLVRCLLCSPLVGAAQQEIPSAETHGGRPEDPVVASPVAGVHSNGIANPTSTASLPSQGSRSVPVSPTSAVRPVQSTVEVSATSSVSTPYRVTQEEILSSAGTWGDFSRYLQLLPGVVWNTDMSNDIMVRGGNPAENLFVVDGIEVPNINHLAVEGTTGGFTSMIDTTAIRSVDLKAGVYDASYSSRLSSLVEVHTRDAQAGAHDSEVDFGIAGMGGMLLRPMGNGGDLQISVHRSVLNLATDDIGINGVPIYTNGMAKLEWSSGAKDHFRALSLSGADSIAITPIACDSGVTLRVQTQYHGWRSTDGLVWQHTHSPQTLSTATMSYSTQSQQIEQQWLPLDTSDDGGCNGPSKPLYSERTSDRTGVLKYALATNWNKWTYTTGVSGQLLALDYAVDQPLGQQSPFNPDPGWTDADSFARNPVLGQAATYIEASGQIGSSLDLMVAMREEIFGLTGTHAFEPRASLSFRFTERQSINGTYSRSSQLVPSINILSYPGNEHLKPIHVDQYSLGADLWRSDWMSLSAEAYHKRYFDEPVSTEYPGLMLANMVDTLGQQFVWLPLKTGGWGRTEGVELLLRAHLADRVQFLGSASYSRTRYAAADGVLRPGNFDFPLVTNGMITARLPGKFQISVRDSYATGRPYTPFNIAVSEQQDRGIYDLTQINALRGPAYNRLDADMNRDFHLFRGILNIHGGLENALDRENFLGYAWESNCGSHVGGSCGENVNALPGVPETVVTQMPLFPSAGVRYSF